jgi:hypothetical protein
MTKDYLNYLNLKQIILLKGHAFFIGNMNLNFVGIRTKNRIADNFDDFFCVLWQELNSIGNLESKILVFDEFTTDPGIYYLKNKLLNPNGCAIMVPGQYRGLWKIGMHGHNKPYKAFCQVGKVQVYRDRNKDNTLDGDASTIQESSALGINLHHGYDSNNVGNNSAGCQVFKHDEDLKTVLDLFEKSIPYNGERITYTLLTENDFIK